MLLGIVTGLRDHVGDVGLVFIDGHEDTMPLDVSEDGEAANTEIGLLLGLTGRLLTGELGDRLPALRARTAGDPRPAGRRVAPAVQRRHARRFRGVDGPARRSRRQPSGHRAACDRAAVGSGRRWWLHIDLDVLDPAEFRAQGLPDVDDEPGGLTWDQLTDLVMALFTGPGSCVGGSLAIYDPDQDPDGAGAAQIVEFVRNVLVRPTISP